MNILNSLIKFYNEDPTDPFNIYALATEYLKSDKNQSLLLFEKLSIEFVDYIPTYYHYGKLLESFNQTEKAKEIYKLGIEIANKVKDSHSSMELKGALQMLLDEELY